MSAFRMLPIALAILLSVFGTTGQARAQVARPAAVAPAATAAAASDKLPEEEAADSPRASVRTFLELCYRGRYDEAAHYLDVPRGSEKRASELARKLHDVLQERLWVEPSRLSPLSQGKKDDALPQGTEELGRIEDSKGRAVPIRIVRHEPRTPDDDPRWVFSQATLVAIDGLHASLKGRWIRDRLPAPLLAQGPGSVYYWQWLAMPVLAIVCLVLAHLLGTLSGAIARWALSTRTWGRPLVERLVRPARMSWALVLFWSLLPYLALTLRAEDLVERLLRALGYLAFFWALVGAVAIAGDEVAEASWARTRPNFRSVTGVGVRLGKFVVAALALMAALSELGYPVTTVIAGLGIGGVALALAAQKTVENLFGSVSILADHPFGVGDVIKVDGVEGTVETIGLRSTRLRTLDRTLVIIPNGKLADMRVESFGPRDRIRFATKLALARDAKPAQLEAVVTSLRDELRAHASVQPDDVIVHLSGIGESSFDIYVSALVDTTDVLAFMKIREELLLTCVRAVDAHGAQLAVPARHVVSPPDKPAAAADAPR